MLNTLKTLALDDPSTSKSAVAASDLRIDLSPLLKDPQGQEVYIISTESSGGKTVLLPKWRKDRVWAVKDGLTENEDFVFISTLGWDKLVQW